MPTQLPDRAPPVLEPTNGPAWIAGILAVGVLIGLTLRAPIPCDIAVDGGCVEAEAPHHFVRIVMARAAPLAIPAR